MLSEQEIEELQKSFHKRYKNEKKGINININKQLFIDHKIMCEELSRKSKKKITPSLLIRSSMYKDILEYEKNNKNN